MQRQPIIEGSQIVINNVKIEIMGYVGEGTTCIVYNGVVISNEIIPQGTLVIVKEFYPSSTTNVFDIERDYDSKLKISTITKDLTEYKDKYTQFQKGYESQLKLSNSSAMEITVKPLLYGAYGDTEYIVSDIHEGKNLDTCDFNSLKHKLSCVLKLTEMMGILHDSNYMMLDFKPENILYIERPEAVKLIDVDSVVCIKLKEFQILDKNRTKEQDEILYGNIKYMSPEMLSFKNLIIGDRQLYRESRSAYLRPSENVYNIGVYFFELLFGRIMTEEDFKFGNNLLDELIKIYEEDVLTKEYAKGILNVLQHSLSQDVQVRYKNANVMLLELQTCVEKITSQKYIQKKDYALANLSHVAYNILEKYPLYDFFKKKDGRYQFDVLIVGNHLLRKTFIKAIFSSAQMLNANINIRILSDDVEEFWESYLIQCPEIQNSILYYKNDIAVNDVDDIKNAGIVSRPLGQIYLYSDNSFNKAISIIKENSLNYVLVLHENEKMNMHYIEELGHIKKKSKAFIGYIGKGCKDEFCKSAIIVPIRLKKISEEYNEENYSSHIFKMGLAVHENYCRSRQPRISLKEIKRTYINDLYSIESNERAALSFIYKLMSVGINPSKKSAPLDFYQILESKDSSSRDVIDNLMVLEQLSWSAQLIFSGVKSADKNILASYAFTGFNDWKRRDKRGNVIAHPCLCACYSGFNLSGEMWETRHKLTPLMVEKLDPLDRASLNVYNAAEKISKLNETLIKNTLEIIKRKVRTGIKSDDVKNCIESLYISVEKIHNRETNSDVLFNSDITNLENVLTSMGVIDDYVDQIMVLKKSMTPAKYLLKYKDFKDDIMAVIKSIPISMLRGNGDDGGRITIIKPIAKTMWQNLYSTIMIEPNQLVIIVRNQRDIDLCAGYESFLRKLGVETRIKTVKHGQIRDYRGKNGWIFVDETGAEGEDCRRIFTNSYLKGEGVYYFKIKDRKIEETDGKKVIKLFDRDITLTVKEVLLLHGAEAISEKTKDYVTGLEFHEYMTIWNVYRKLNNNYKWHIFVNELEHQEYKRSKRIEILEKKEKNETYISNQYVEHFILEYSRLDILFEFLRKNGLISRYSIPNYGKCSKITWTTYHPEISEELMKLIKNAVAYPSQNRYIASMGTDKKGKSMLYIRNDSLAFRYNEIPHEKPIDYKEKTIGESYFRDDVFKEVCTLFDEVGHDAVIQGYEHSALPDGSGISVSYRYVSESVKNILMKEGSILEALIYHECQRNNIFDDIRVNVEFTWGKDNENKNEIDVIGTKKSRAYFISAKMSRPENMHLYEVENHSKKFGDEFAASAILISSNKVTGKDEITHKYYYERPYALEKRAESTENVYYIGKDGVDIIENRERKIVIADSIMGIVRKDDELES